MQMSISAGRHNGDCRVVLGPRELPDGLKAGDSFMLDELGDRVSVLSVVNGTVFTRLGDEDYKTVKAAAENKAAA